MVDGKELAKYTFIGLGGMISRKRYARLSFASRRGLRLADTDSAYKRVYHKPSLTHDTLQRPNCHTTTSRRPRPLSFRLLLLTSTILRSIHHHHPEKNTLPISHASSTSSFPSLHVVVFPCTRTPPPSSKASRSCNNRTTARLCFTPWMPCVEIRSLDTAASEGKVGSSSSSPSLATGGRKALGMLSIHISFSLILGHGNMSKTG